MDGYHIALFVHFCALLGAIATAAIVHISTSRRDGAKILGDQLAWHSTLLSAAKFFPLALVTLLVSGGYMLSKGGQPWSSPFVSAGLAGIVLLFAMGGFLSAKGRALQKRLEQLVKESGVNGAPVSMRDSVIELLQNMPLGIVVAVVFDMTTKPAVVTAMGLIALGAVVGGVIGVAHRNSG